jgi:hypothetical protein
MFGAASRSSRLTLFEPSRGKLSQGVQSGVYERQGPKTGGFSLLDYVNDATVHVVSAQTLNSYVTKENTLMTVLWKARPEQT